MARLHGREFSETQICELYSDLRAELGKFVIPDIAIGLQESIASIKIFDPCDDEKIMDVLSKPDRAAGLNLNKLHLLVELLRKETTLTNYLAKWVIWFAQDLKFAHEAVKADPAWVCVV